MPHLKTLLLAALATIAAAACAKPAPAATSCAALASVANSARDATQALRDCIERTPQGGRLELAPATYTLRQQLRILRPITLATAGVTDSAAGCATLGATRCATLKVDLDGAPNPNIMPIEIAGNDIAVTHLVIAGTTNAKVRADCALADRRPLGGGMRVLGSRFTMRKSRLRDFTCYTTMEVLAGAKSLTLEDNHVGPNGDHRPGDIWSDGITIHDSEDTIVRRNRFVDNTDVQLILGGCRRCRIEQNKFSHSGSFARASFAELMLQAFPSTTGDYTGTLVTANTIDCGAARLCGYGIMIGANPWKAGNDPRYPGAMFGGTVRGNRVANALIGINIDSPTGPVDIHGNTVTASGGPRRSDCGTHDWPAVNVAPRAVGFVRGDPSNLVEGHITTTSCIVNRQPN